MYVCMYVYLCICVYIGFCLRGLIVIIYMYSNDGFVEETIATFDAISQFYILNPDYDVCTYMFIYACAYIFVCAYFYVYTCVCACAYMRMYFYMRVRL